MGIEQYALIKKYQIIQIDSDKYMSFDYASLFQDAPRLVLIIGSSPKWVKDTLDFFGKESIKVVLLDSFASEHPAICARIKPDYSSIVKPVLQHLKDCGCSRPAIYGLFVHSSADVEKVKSFLKEIDKQGIGKADNICFENKSDLEDCYLNFKPHIQEFDSVICVNELAAVSLMKHLRTDGFCIPDDIQIISCGNETSLGKVISPSLTTMSSMDSVIGRTALSAFKYCYSSDDISFNMQLMLKYVLNVGESTSPLNKNISSAENTVTLNSEHSSEELQLNFYRDTEIQSLSSLEKAFRYCDETDINILKMRMDNVSYDKISESLCISRSTLFYRLRRIEDNISLESHSGLKAYLTKNKFWEIFNKS